MLNFSEWLRQDEALQLVDKKPFKKKKKPEVKSFEKSGKLVKPRRPINPNFALVSINPTIASGELNP
jgi:hypothetical protein